MTTMLNFDATPKLKLIKDVGNGNRFTHPKSYAARIITAGTETRTITNPSFVGQFALLTFLEDGGDCVITAMGAINQSGNNTITMGDVGDTVLLVGRVAGSVSNPLLRWSVAMNDGCTLTTV